MTDALIKSADPQDHFVEFHNLESRIKALETAVAQMLGGMLAGNVAGFLDILEKRVGKTELALAKQRAVNEAYLKWIADSAEHQNVAIGQNSNLAAVCDALREALK